MCSSERFKEVKPELPELELDLDDPLTFIPTDLRPTEHRHDDYKCPMCGGPISEDELATHGRHRGHDSNGFTPGFRPKERLTPSSMRPDYTILHQSEMEKPPEL